MIKVHHLNDSRSQRILWLLEELDLPYEIVKHQRDEKTRFSPPSLRAVHPLGKAPLIEDDGRVIAESGAIVEYLVTKYGKGRLAPATTAADWPDYIQLLHYAEGSAMVPLLLSLYASRLGEGAAPLLPRIKSELANHLGFMERTLGDKPYFLGKELSGVDILLSFVVEAAATWGVLSDYPNLKTFAARIHARPAWRRAVDKGGSYAFEK